LVLHLLIFDWLQRIHAGTESTADSLKAKTKLYNDNYLSHYLNDLSRTRRIKAIQGKTTKLKGQIFRVIKLNGTFCSSVLKIMKKD